MLQPTIGMETMSFVFTFFQYAKFKALIMLSGTFSNTDIKHDKTNVMRLRPAWIQTSLRFRAV
jgi:hypothetical protein